MKTRTFIIVAFIAAFFASCKNENKTEGAEGPQVEESSKFSVVVDVISEKKEDFALYFTEDGTSSFTEKGVVWSGTKEGEAGSQKVEFLLPEEIIPTHIRLDFGMKKGAEQGDVTLRNVKVSYAGKSFEFKGSDFFKYFIENKDVKTEINAADGTIKFLKNPTGTQTPFYYPTQVVVDEIAKITK